MKELKATPGPWWVEPETGDVVAKDGDWEICTFSRSDHQHEADAHLIAAAPELYSVLETAVMQGERILNGDPPAEGEDFDGWFLAAKAALAKARGEQP